MGHTYQSYRSTNSWSFCQLGAEMLGSFWQTNAPPLIGISADQEQDWLVVSAGWSRTRRTCLVFFLFFSDLRKPFSWKLRTSDGSSVKFWTCKHKKWDEAASTVLKQSDLTIKLPCQSYCIDSFDCLKVINCHMPLEHRVLADNLWQISDPFVSLVQKWLEASGKQMRHSRYGLIRTRRTCLVCSKSFFRSDEASFLQKLHTSLHTSDWSVILLTL